MGRNIPTQELGSATPSIEVEVLSGAEKARITARMTWDENPDDTLPEVAVRVSELISDPTERNYAMAALLEMSRERLDSSLKMSEFNDVDVVRAVNRFIEEMDSGVGEIENGHDLLNIPDDEVA